MFADYKCFEKNLLIIITITYYLTSIPARSGCQLILRREENHKTRRKTLEARGRDQLQQLYSHEFQVIMRINTRLYPIVQLYPIVVTHRAASYNTIRSGLTWNSVVKRQRTNPIRHPCLNKSYWQFAI